MYHWQDIFHNDVYSLSESNPFEREKSQGKITWTSGSWHPFVIVLWVFFGLFHGNSMIFNRIVFIPWNIIIIKTIIFWCINNISGTRTIWLALWLHPSVRCWSEEAAFWPNFQTWGENEFCYIFCFVYRYFLAE